MEEAATQHWNTRALERQIGTLYYERLLASKDRQPLREEAAHNLAEIQATPSNYLLKCFVIFDLKTRELTHQDIGQMDIRSPLRRPAAQPRRRPHGGHHPLCAK